MREVRYAAHINAFVTVRKAPCQVCGQAAPMDKHHRHPNTDKDSPEHWVYLCKACDQ